MSEYVADLRGAIEEFTPLLEQMSDEATRKRAIPRLERAKTLAISSPNRR